MKKEFPSRQDSAFSLVEIIATVGIIGLLAALLFPAMQGMLEKSRSATCLNNLRQIGVLAALYRAENGKPLPSELSSDGNRRAWPRLLFELTPDYSSTGVQAAMTRKSYSYFWCPEFVRKYGQEAANSTGRSSYSINVYFSDTFPNVIDGGRVEPYIIDGSIRSDGQKMALPAVQDVTTGVGRYHSNHANALFYDGSVRSMTEADIDSVAKAVADRKDFQ